MPLYWTVILAEPAFTAVTNPVSSTVAISGESHTNSQSLLAISIGEYSAPFSPTTEIVEVLSSCVESNSIVAGVAATSATLRAFSV